MSERKRRHRWDVAGDAKRSIYAHCLRCGTHRYKYVGEGVYRFVRGASGMWNAPWIASIRRGGPVPPCEPPSNKKTENA